MTLLLDVHLPRAVVATLQRRLPRLDVQHITEWREGHFRTADDAIILAACHEEGRTWVTLDKASVPPLLLRWAEEGRPHSGVLFATRRRMPPNAPGASAQLLAKLVTEIGDTDVTNLVRYLQ
ncbi:MAG: DUF5615 family PIN-like protein [Verrucomicrobiae bacterium]|nr:DUF5615 family PIN-like protein [Verrucomicrobiae bacterium]